MAVDKEQAHWECRKCKIVFDNSGYRSAKDDKCSSGGKHNFNHVPPSFNNTAIGMAVGMFSSKNKVKDEETLKREELEQQQDDERRLKAKQDLANKTLKIYDVIKPYLKYLKFIIPVYIVGITITYFIVDKQNKFAIIFFGCIPFGIVIYLAYNALINKPKS